jgi:hypothetical protein
VIVSRKGEAIYNRVKVDLYVSRQNKIGLTMTLETKRRLELLFRPADQAQAIRWLETRCSRDIPGFPNPDEQQLERLHFAALRLSDGDLAALKRSVELAHVDFRDLLTGAGFGSLHTHETWLPSKKW